MGPVPPMAFFTPSYVSFLPQGIPVFAPPIQHGAQQAHIHQIPVPPQMAPMYAGYGVQLQAPPAPATEPAPQEQRKTVAEEVEEVDAFLKSWLDDSEPWARMGSNADVWSPRIGDVSDIWSAPAATARQASSPQKSHAVPPGFGRPMSESKPSWDALGGIDTGQWDPLSASSSSMWSPADLFSSGRGLSQHQSQSSAQEGTGRRSLDSQFDVFQNHPRIVINTQPSVCATQQRS